MRNPFDSVLIYKVGTLRVNRDGEASHYYNSECKLYCAILLRYLLSADRITHPPPYRCSGVIVRLMCKNKKNGDSSKHDSMVNRRANLPHAYTNSKKKDHYTLCVVVLFLFTNFWTTLQIMQVQFYKSTKEGVNLFGTERIQPYLIWRQHSRLDCQSSP